MQSRFVWVWNSGSSEVNGAYSRVDANTFERNSSDGKTYRVFRALGAQSRVVKWRIRRVDRTNITKDIPFYNVKCALKMPPPSGYRRLAGKLPLPRVSIVPSSVYLLGAGTKGVNGEYKYFGVHDGAPAFELHPRVDGGPVYRIARNVKAAGAGSGRRSAVKSKLRAHCAWRILRYPTGLSDTPDVLYSVQSRMVTPPLTGYQIQAGAAPTPRIRKRGPKGSAKPPKKPKPRASGEAATATTADTKTQHAATDAKITRDPAISVEDSNRALFLGDEMLSDEIHDIFDRFDTENRGALLLRGDHGIKDIIRILFPKDDKKALSRRVRRAYASDTNKSRAIDFCEFQLFLWAQMDAKAHTEHNAEAFLDMATEWVGDLSTRAAHYIPAQRSDSLLAELQAYYELVEVKTLIQSNYTNVVITEELKDAFLAKGTFQTVYAVRSRLDQRVLGVKACDLRQVSCAEKNTVIAKAQKEASVMVRLANSGACPHIVRYHHLAHHVSERGSSYVFTEMELCRHTLFDETNNEKPLHVREILDYTLQLSRGLAHAHKIYILHGKIQPRDILFGLDGNLKISGFYLARDFGHAISKEERKALAKQLGPRLYHAPEAEPVLGSYDMWALGVVVAEMMINKSPLVSTGMPIHQDTKLIDEILQDADKRSKQLGIVLRGLLELDPNRRLTADQIVKMLDSELADTTEAVLKSIEGKIDKQRSALDAVASSVGDARREVKQGVAAIRSDVASLSERIDGLFQLVVGLAEGPDAMLMPTCVLVLPASDSKVEGKGGLLSWLTALADRTTDWLGLTRHFAIYVCDEGPRLLSHQKPTGSAAAGASPASSSPDPLHAPFRVELPGKVLVRLAPVIRAMCAIAVVAQAAAETIAPIARVVPRIAMFDGLRKAGGDRLAVIAADLGDAVETTSIDDEHGLIGKDNKTSKPQELVGEAFHSLRAILMPDGAAEPPRNDDGECLADLLGRKIIRVVSSKGSYHWVDPKHWPKLEALGYKKGQRSAGDEFKAKQQPASTAVVPAQASGSGSGGTSTSKPVTPSQPTLAHPKSAEHDDVRTANAMPPPKSCCLII